MTTTLFSDNTNSFDSIFEKKSISENSQLVELTTASSFHEQILKKTLSFRNSFLENPKKKLLNFFKDFKFPFLNFSFSFVPLILGISGFYYIHNSAILCLLGVICFFSTLTFIGCLFEVCNFKKQKKEYIQLINSISSVQCLFNIPKNICSHLDTVFFSSLYLSDNQKFKDSVHEFKTLKPENLQAFLNSFSREEISFINNFLIDRFENNTIQSLVIDDLIDFLEEKLNIIQKQQSHIIKNNNFKDFIADYIPNEEKTKTFKSLL